MLPGLATMLHSSAVSAGAGLVEISDATARKFTVGAAAVASYTIGADGNVLRNGIVFENWLKSGVAAGYDVRATLVSGGTPSGMLGSWLNLAATRSWSLSQSMIGTNTCILTIDIALTTTTVPLDSATISIIADMEGA